MPSCFLVCTLSLCLKWNFALSHTCMLGANFFKGHSPPTHQVGRRVDFQTVVLSLSLSSVLHFLAVSLQHSLCSPFSLGLQASSHTSSDTWIVFSLCTLFLLPSATSKSILLSPLSLPLPTSLRLLSSLFIITSTSVLIFSLCETSLTNFNSSFNYLNI